MNDLWYKIFTFEVNYEKEKTKTSYRYNVYTIHARQLHFSLSLHIYELDDDFTWTSIFKTELHSLPLVNRTTEMVNIQIDSLIKNQHSISNKLLNDFQYLLVRQPKLIKTKSMATMHSM